MSRSFLSGWLIVLVVSGLVGAQDLPQDLLLSQVQDGQALVTDAEPSRGVDIQDFDGDGILDVFVVNLDVNNALYYGDGTGTFTRQALGQVGEIVDDAGNSRGIASGDIDNDGDVDVYVCNSLGEPNNFYVNDGGLQLGTQGHFTAQGSGHVTAVTDNSRNAIFADLDDDGDLDLFVANFNNQDNSYFVNQGGAQAGTIGTFAASAMMISTQGGVSYGADVADLDLDGDLDLFVTNHDGLMAPSPGSVNFLYINQGGVQGGTTGDFVRDNTGPVGTDISNSLCAGFADMDGNGFEDLFVANDEGEDNNLYSNLGALTFVAVTSDPVVNTRGESIACLWADLDNDGDSDLIVGNRKGQANNVYLNDGTGAFAEQAFGPLTTDVNDTYGLAAADLVDGPALENYVDVVVANLDNSGGGGFGANLVYNNDGPQWRDELNALAGTSGNPILSSGGNLLGGTNASLDTSNGAANAIAFFVIGASQLNAPLKGGIIVPNPDIVIDGLVTDAMGALPLGGTVPAGIIGGVTLFFQTWMQDAGAVQGFSATNAVSVVTP